MKFLSVFFCVIFQLSLFAQVNNDTALKKPKSIRIPDSLNNKKVASIDLYKVITLNNDTTYIDTSLTIQKEYSHNYLRKDIFGLLPFANDGQTYNTLQFSLIESNALPEFGFKAKHFNFLDANHIRYYAVATPVTELYFKSTINRGQSADAFITLNTSENLNFSIAYKGLRSEGEYINQLASTGNFRFTTSYKTRNKRYVVKAHYTFQDIFNEENGGITTLDDFESENPNFNNRQRFEVFFTDATSFLKGRRIFVDHQLRINPKNSDTNLFLSHQVNFENKFFEYNQQTVGSIVGSENVARFGESFITENINDQTRFNKLYNKVGVTVANNFLGVFHFFIDDFRANTLYNRVLIFNNGLIIPSLLHQEINTFSGQYTLNRLKWSGDFSYQRSITPESLSNLNAKIQINFQDDILLKLSYQNLNKLPNNNFNLFQSSYIQYNWSNDFKNEKRNIFNANLTSPWVDIDFQYTVLNDYLHFKDSSTIEQKAARTQVISPAQFNGTINYASLKLSKEINFGNFALDNIVLLQKTAQDQRILNVPEIVTRNTIYYSNYFFKSALFLQTGISLNYFTKYFANEYNPLIGEFFVQNEKLIGNHPNLDFFINAKIQRTRIYLKAEHFNSSFTGNNFYSSPNNPARDFTIRFGIIWNFFN